MSRSDSENLFYKILRIIGIIFLALFFVFGITLFAISIWYRNTYRLEFKELLYILTSPLEGTGAGTINAILTATLPYAIAAAVLVIFSLIVYYAMVKPYKKGRLFFKSACILVSVSVLISSGFCAVYSFGIDTYFNNASGNSELYGYYVDPLEVDISGENTNNLIYIYVESLESSHLKVENGGFMTEDYMPNLNRLAYDNTSFSHLEAGKLGGFYTPLGTTWTIAALLSTTAGIPFAFSVGHNNMDKQEYFAPGLTNLGDVLEGKGYNQEFICGSDAGFGGRKKYFTQHGNYEIFDLYTARSEGYVSSDYYNNWWGFEDKYLFEIAKNEVLELASKDEPFNLTLLTVDTHPEDGFICSLCKNDYDSTTANVISCIDKQVSEFVEWCKQQVFYENTTIIITGDHLRMDDSLVKNVEYNSRRVYNCIINPKTETVGQENNRLWTSFDMFPTTLAAMGFEIEGERLGLGTNMFSDKQTLAELKGLDYIYLELLKPSAFYDEKFCKVK